jgi:hypothetical protein
MIAYNKLQRDIRLAALSDFLRRRKIDAIATKLPLVHVTRAINLKKFIKDNEIRPSKCDVFGDDLSYFFLGRPAYKLTGTANSAAYWELPACFVFDGGAVPYVDRVFPFDSGAHHFGKLPSFVQAINLAEFEVVGMPNAPEKIIRLFFGSDREYFHLQPKDRQRFEAEFSLGVFDEEIRALHALASITESITDDRRFCVEIQSRATVSMLDGHLMAVICPAVYFDDREFRTHVENVWHAEAISYNLYPLNLSNYVSQIYQRVDEFYRQRGIL